MKAESREELIDYAMKGGPQWFLNIALIGLLAFISLPFVWIWISWDLAWRIGLTGFLAMLIFGSIYLSIKRDAEKHVDDIIKKHEQDPKPKSRFQSKMDEMIAKSKQV